MKLSLKHKLIIAAIILGGLIGGIGIFQALGFWENTINGYIIYWRNSYWMVY